MKKFAFIFTLVLACLTSSYAGNNSSNIVSKKVVCVATFKGMFGSITVDNGSGGDCMSAWLTAANIYFELTD